MFISNLGTDRDGYQSPECNVTMTPHTNNSSDNNMAVLPQFHPQSNYFTSYPSPCRTNSKRKVKNYESYTFPAEQHDYSQGKYYKPSVSADQSQRGKYMQYCKHRPHLSKWLVQQNSCEITNYVCDNPHYDTGPQSQRPFNNNFHYDHVDYEKQHHHGNSNSQQLQMQQSVSVPSYLSVENLSRFDLPVSTPISHFTQQQKLIRQPSSKPVITTCNAYTHSLEPSLKNEVSKCSPLGMYTSAKFSLASTLSKETILTASSNGSSPTANACRTRQSATVPIGTTEVTRQNKSPLSSVSKPHQNGQNLLTTNTASVNTTNWENYKHKHHRVLLKSSPSQLSNDAGNKFKGVNINESSEARNSVLNNSKDIRDGVAGQETGEKSVNESRSEFTEQSTVPTDVSARQVAPERVSVLKKVSQPKEPNPLR